MFYSSGLQTFLAIRSTICVERKTCSRWIQNNARLYHRQHSPLALCSLFFFLSSLFPFPAVSPFLSPSLLFPFSCFYFLVLNRSWYISFTVHHWLITYNIENAWLFGSWKKCRVWLLLLAVLSWEKTGTLQTVNGLTDLAWGEESQHEELPVKKALPRCL